MAGKIFINYRRGDDPGFTQALYQRLEDEFSAADLFMDVEGHIKPGDDFVEVLNRQVVAADVLLAVIGPRWEDLLAARAADPDDFVAIEIKAALENGKRVVPVLVGGAGMPKAGSLPPAIRPLARRNAVGLRPERFKADCQGLVTALREQLAAAETERAAQTVAEREAAEAARRQAEAESAARLTESEERERAQRVAGLSSGEIRKAEELANWDFIKARRRPDALRDHLARFPGGVTIPYALATLEELVWAGLVSGTTDREALQAFVEEFPTGAQLGAAKARLAELDQQALAAEAIAGKEARETAAWGAIAASTDKAPIEWFLQEWPGGQHWTAARSRLKELSRGKDSRGRSMLLGAGAMAVVVALGYGGWQIVEKISYQLSLIDSTLNVLDRAKLAALPNRQSFKECEHCPEMVVVPAGKFMMGSVDGEAGHQRDESPQHEVAIRKAFAVGMFEVTRGQFAAFVQATGYKPGNNCNVSAGKSWHDLGFPQTDEHPVACVSLDNAKAYAAWLSAKTGRSYRLISEAEWEYAARAGTTGRYSWGDQIGSGNANCVGCGSQWDNKGTAPVGSFNANSFGLFDLHGNVWEWVEDCYFDLYGDGPATEAPRVAEGCIYRVIRGGSWSDNPSFMRAAYRIRYLPDNRDVNVGFRLARTLTP